MEKRIITTEHIVSFGQFLREDERSAATVENRMGPVSGSCRRNSSRNG